MENLTTGQLQTLLKGGLKDLSTLSDMQLIELQSDYAMARLESYDTDKEYKLVKKELEKRFIPVPKKEKE